MDKEFVQIFREVIEQYVSTVCENYSLLNSLIADHVRGDFYKERKLLIWILETNYHKTITPEYDFEEWKQEYVTKLNTEEFIDKESASRMIDIIFQVFFGEPYYIERGFKLLENNSQKMAEIAFDKAIDLVPNSSEAFKGKGIIALAREDYDNAIEYFSVAIRYNPKSKQDINIQLAKAYGERGSNRKKRHNYKSAISDFEQAFTSNPDVYYLESLVGCYHAVSDYLSEAACYTKLIDLEPDNISFIMHRAGLYLQLEKYQNAIDDFDEILKHDGLLIDAYEKRSFAYFKLKKYDTALEDCQAILNIDQQNASAFYHSSLLFLEILNFSKARENIDNAIRHDSVNKLTAKTAVLKQKIDYKEAEYYEKLGDDYFSQGKPDDAIITFSKSIELMPSCNRVYLKRGNIFNEEGDVQSARDDYQKSLELSTKPLEKSMASGFVCLIDKNYKEAIANFLNAVKINEDCKTYLYPYLTKAYTAEAIIQKNHGDFDTAIKYLSDVIKIDDKNRKYLAKLLAESYMNKGLLLLDNNNLDEAIVYFNNTINTDISLNELILPSLAIAYCKKGDIEKDKNDFKTAIINYEKALEINKSNEIFIKVAQCYHWFSKFKDEIVVLNKLILAAPRNIDLYMMRAEAYTLSKNYCDALKDYDIINEIEKKYIISYLKRLNIFFIQKDYRALIDVCSIILDIDPNNKIASYICNIYNKDANNMAVLVEKRKEWEGTMGYHETSSRFKCYNCLFYDNKTGVCNEMKKSHIFAFSSDSSLCHQYRKH